MQLQTADLPSLYDENVFRLLMDYEIKRSQRYISPLTLLRVAIVIDRPSAQEIKAAPTALASMLNSRLRAADLPAKFGNEYAVLLPATDEAGGCAVCERFLGAATGTHSTSKGVATRLAVCIGMACHNGGPTMQADTMIQEAESALSKARSQGPQHYVIFSKMFALL